MAKKENKKISKGIEKETTSDKSSEIKVSKKNNQADNLLKKYGLDANDAVEVSESSKKEKEVKTKKEEKIDQVELEKKSEDTIESLETTTVDWKNWKELLLNFLYGIFMGISDAIPGYSGGTTLSLIGFYEKLVKNFKSIFKPSIKKDFWKYLLWFIPFAIAWCGVLIGMMKLVDVVADANMAVILVFLFGSFAFFSIPLFALVNKNKMINYKEIISKEPKTNNQKIHIIVFTVAILIMIGIGLASRFVPTTILNDGTTIIGVTFADNSEQWASTSDTGQILMLIVSAFFAGFALLIPGLSGSMVLFTTGWYPKISQMLSDIVSGVPGSTNYIPWLMMLIVGVTLGIILASFVINIIIEKWEKIFYTISFGLVCGSFITVFVSLSAYEYSFLSNPTTLALSITMIFVAVIVNAGIFVFLNQTKKINYPKFFISKKTETKTTVIN
ncbi:MAG: undecaprenyl phosphate translocase family protein [Mycoplasma sp.]